MIRKITKSVAILLVICTTLMVFSGCELFITNDRADVDLMTVEETVDGLNFYVSFYYGRGQKFFYEKDSGNLFWEDYNDQITLPQIVLQGATTAHGRVVAIEGYEALLDQVLAFSIEDVEYPVHHALAYKLGDVVYGFCNVYSTAGAFTDGLDCKGIEYAVLFTYDSDTETLTVVERLEKRIVVAFDGTGVIWYENKAYYGKAMGGTEVKICDDEAYRSNFRSSFGRVSVYFGGGYCIIYFDCDFGYFVKGDPYKKCVLVTMSGEKLAEFEQVTIYD